MPEIKLTTTSYAILGQLALRSWSAYELTAEMKRNFHYFWPRAESGIYSEIKRLEKLGLAQSERSSVGKRPRTVYSITPNGCDVLTEWLSTPPGEFSLEFEGLLRMFFANLGTQGQLFNNLNQVESDAQEMINVGARVGREYLENRAPFQKYVDMRVFVFHFLLHYAHWFKEWAGQAKTEMESWEGLSREEKKKKALQLIEADMKKFGLPLDSD
jgi:DNA-binding PadR family transcriptional regulator